MLNQYSNIAVSYGFRFEGFFIERKVDPTL